MSTRHTFTSESVTEGHPDKMADQISDSVLDAVIEQDPRARVACETLLTTGLVVVAGEISTECYVDIPSLVRDVVCDIGYDTDAHGFNGRTCGVMVALDAQSPDIAQGVTAAHELRTGSGGEDQLNAQGAGDQGMMFGYACDETPDLMPLPIWLAHRLAQRLAQVRRVGVLPYLRPDGKTQVSVIYEDGRPVAIDTILISTQHAPGVDIETLLLPDLREHVIHPLLPSDLDTEKLRVLANPTGRFELGGPHADTGLTGRKIIVDTYGGMARHGGGRLLGQGPLQGRPVGRLRGPLGGQARGGARGRPAAARSRWPTPSGWPTRCRSWWRPSGPTPSTRLAIEKGVREVFDLRPGGHRPRPRSPAAHLPADRRLRALRPDRQGIHVGGDAQDRRPEAGAGSLDSRPVPEAGAGGSAGGSSGSSPTWPPCAKEFDYTRARGAGRERPGRDPRSGSLWGDAGWPAGWWARAPTPPWG